MVSLLRQRHDRTGLDWLAQLVQILPAGLSDNRSLQRYLHNILAAYDVEDDFSALARKLFVIATDLDCGQRAVFGPGYQENVPVSLAVAASAALSLLYKPVRIGDHDYIDGGLRGTASLDVAIEQGAKLVVCVNPLVPLDCRPAGQAAGHHLSDQGVAAVSAQVSRILTHAGLAYHIKQLRRHHTDVDIILIEPRFDDTAMFSANIMRYSTRLQVAQHGFESVTLDLAEDYPRYKAILVRHGVEITRRLVIEEFAAIHAAGNSPEVLRRILEKSAERHQRVRSQSQLTRRLERALQRVAELYP